jgi:hypothetical protein
VKQFFTQLITARDNFTVDAFKVLAIVAVVVGLALEIASTLFPLAGQKFDLQAYGIGLGALLLSVGGAIRLKADADEPSVTVRSSSETTVTETK